MTDSTLRFIVFHRIGHYCHVHGYKAALFIIRVLSKFKIINNHNSEIPFSTEFGPGLYIGHFNSITVNAHMKFGRNINIHKGATIGRENRGFRKGVPTIGNNVYIGINAVITGRITVGDNVLIGPNTHVNFDVPSDSVVYGNPAIIKHSPYATKYYVNNVC